MIRFLLSDTGGVRSGDRRLFEAWKSDAQSWLWIDLCDQPANDEFAFLTGDCDLDEQDVEDAQRSRHPPQFHTHGADFFLLLKPLQASSHDMDFSTHQVALFVSDRLLVTRRTQDWPYLDARWQALVEGREQVSGAVDLVAVFTRRLAERYGSVLLGLERRLDDIEDVLLDSRGDALMQELVSYNTALRKMRRILAYHVEVYGRLSRHVGDHHPDHADEFRDRVEVIERFNSLATLYQDVINDLIEGYISLNGHNLNQIMKVLTVVTVTFVPLSLLVGIYGMNFENMPELKAEHGYYILIAVMGAIAGGLLYLFRRMRWL